MTGQFFAPFLSALVIFSFRLSASILMLHLKTVFRAHGFYGGERLPTVTNSTEVSSVVPFVLVLCTCACACIMYLCFDLLVCTWRCHQWWQIALLCLMSYVSCTCAWMYTKVSSVLVTRPVITLYSLLYWIEILCNKVDIESTGVGNPLHALLILSRENPATHSFPNCTVSSALLVFFIFAGLPIICFNTGHWCSVCEIVQEYIDLHFGSLGANWLLRWNKAFTSELCTCTRGWFGVTLPSFWECGKRGLAIVFTG